MRKKTRLNQWKNVYAVIDWFEKLENKKEMVFIVFDVVNYYPSITLELLEKAIDWAKQFVNITDKEMEILKETKKSILYMNNEAWTKKGAINFDVAQGGFDSAEVCDLVGLFLLAELKNEKLNMNAGVFRDDGLGVSSATSRVVEQMKKKICSVYKKHGLNLTVDANKKIVQFLDVELDLMNESYKPFTKPNDIPLYVHKLSNHPPSVTKNIPAAINKRISALSSSEEIFKSVAPSFQQALKNAGYEYEMKYEKHTNQPKKRNRSNKKHILYWNPPFSLEVKTNIGAKFLKLIDKHFPKSNPLHGVFNRNKVKMSYRITPNLKKIIAAQNSKVIKQSENSDQTRTCNCPRTKTCPLQGKCLLDNVVYQATVKSDNSEETYVGLASTTFKSRLGNHQKAMKNSKYRHDTTLSLHIWDLKDRGEEYEIYWKGQTIFTHFWSLQSVHVREIPYLI